MIETATSTARSRSLLPLLAVALAATLAPQAPAARAQAAGEPGAAPAGSVSERIDVALVEVDVWVTDRDGRPVTGLDPSSFEVSHDGEPVAIRNFSEVRDGRLVAATEADAPEATTPEAPAPAAPAHFVLFFDLWRLHPVGVQSLVAALEELLDTEAVEPGRVLILSQDRGLAVEAPFGSSREQLTAALERLAGGTARGLNVEGELRTVLDSIRTAWREAEELSGSAADGIAQGAAAAAAGAAAGGGVGSTPGAAAGGPRSVVGGVGSGGGSGSCGLFVNRIQPVLDGWTRTQSARLMVTLSHLSDTVGFLSGLPGVKNLVYLADGLDTQPGSALASYASSLCPGAGMDLRRESHPEELSDLFLELTRRANTNRVTLHALQARGLRTSDLASAASSGGVRGSAGQRSSGVFDAANRASERDGLALIAAQTGGRAVLGVQDLGDEVAALAAGARSYYSLAFEPPPGDDGGRPRGHRIEVDVDNRAWTVRYRRGYRERAPGQWLTERVEGALNLGIIDNPLAVRLGAGAAQGATEGRFSVTLHVLVPVERLTFEPATPEPGAGQAAEVAVEILARGLGNDVLARREQSFRIRGAPGATGFADLPLVLELEPGAYLAAVGVEDRGSGVASFVSTTLRAGDGGATGEGGEGGEGD